MEGCGVDDCGRTVIARAMCTKHYQRWKRANPDLVAPSDWGKPAIDRLLSRCAERDGCWIYGGVTDHKGYARLRADSGRSKVFGHRLAWEFFIGPIPDGLTFDHLCETPSCVNPWHGDLVPILVNIRRASRGMAAVNRLKTVCPAGHSYDDPSNLVASAPGRVCRTCRNEANRRYRARKKAAA